MKRNTLVVLMVFLLAGCYTPSDSCIPPRSPYEVWSSRLNEGQLLTIQAAVLAAEVFNESYDHTIKEMKESPALVESLRNKIYTARRLNRRAKSWELSKMPPPPEEPTSCYLGHWVLEAPGLPVRIDYAYTDSRDGKVFSALNVVTLRGVKVLSWMNRMSPTWDDPFVSYVNSDLAVLDADDLILHISTKWE